MKFKFWLESFDAYPTKSWIKSLFRWSIPRVNVKMLDAFIVGSEAKGTAKSESDLDIGVVIEPIRGKTALQKTEEYHASFLNDDDKPKWMGRVVDIQFFYPNDLEFQKYSKIKLM